MNDEGQRLDVCVLGTPLLALGGQPVVLKGKSLALVCYLALEGSTRRGVLADLLWSDHGEDDARRNLRRELHRLRATPMGASVAVQGERLALSTALDLDLHRFRASMDWGDVTRAAALLRGPFLDGVDPPAASGFAEWRERWAAELQEEQLRALLARAAELAAHEPGRAAELYQRCLRLDPLREQVHRELIGLHLLHGELDGAQARYHALERQLMNELGVHPLPETQALYARIRQQAEATQMTPVPLTLLPMPAAPPSSELEQALVQVPLVGRGPALAALAHHRALLLTGAAGVGKTRLLREFLGDPPLGRSFLGRSRFLLIQASAERQTQTYAALIELFRSLDESLHGLAAAPRGALKWLLSPPELGARPQHSDGEIAPGPASHLDLVQLLAQAVLYLLGGAGAVLVVEDVHLLDLPTLEVVAEVLRRGPGRVLLTARGHELQARSDLGVLLSALMQEGRLARHELNELSEAEVGELIGALTGQSAPLFARRLYQATAGHPLFLLETLRALGEAGELSVSGGLWGTPYDQQTVDYQEIPVAPSVRQAILTRVERLGDAARRVLHAAALASEPFGPLALGQVCAMGEWEVLELLERAEGLRLLRPLPGGFGFEHDLYRQATLSDIGASRRTLIHRQLARTLRQQDAEPGLIAFHLEQAGEQAEAWSYWHEAGLAALRVFAYPGALAHFEAGAAGAGYAQRRARASRAHLHRPGGGQRYLAHRWRVVAAPGGAGPDARGSGSAGRP